MVKGALAIVAGYVGVIGVLAAVGILIGRVVMYRL